MPLYCFGWIELYVAMKIYLMMYRFLSEYEKNQKRHEFVNIHYRVKQYKNDERNTRFQKINLQ
jgi:hypothetical protein